jgi:hypothetical protein
LGRWRDEEEGFRAVWGKKSRLEKVTVDKEWLDRVPAPVRGAKKVESKL